MLILLSSKVVMIVCRALRRVDSLSAGSQLTQKRYSIAESVILLSPKKVASVTFASFLMSGKVEFRIFSAFSTGISYGIGMLR